MDLDSKLTLDIYMLILLVVTASVLAIYAMYRTVKDKSKNRQFAIMLSKLRGVHEEFTDVDKMKTAFINSITHEIRTPLNAINGFAAIITDKSTVISDEEREEYVSEMMSSSAKLTRLIEDLANLASINNEETRVSIEDVSIAEILENARQKHKPGKGVAMFIEDNTPPYDTFRSDSRIITRIIDALLSNACKFTEKGSIDITCDYSANMKSLVIAVSDTGPGIPKDKVETIFKRFTKLDEFAPGNGLGLYVSRKEAALIGARLYCDANCMEGARFVLEIPLKHK